MDIAQSPHTTLPPQTRRMLISHAINRNRTGQGITVAMLPNAAQHGCNAICHLFPFTKWILEPTLGLAQAQQVAIAFTEDTINQQAAWQWDLTNKCVLQAKSTLIGCTLNDFPIYNLTMTQLPTTVTMRAQPDIPSTVAQANSNWHTNTAAQTPTDLDSLSHSTLSQGMWFTTTTMQLDALATWQNKIEAQTSHQLSTILAQLKTIRTTMEGQRHWQDHYDNYKGYNRDQPSTPEQSNMEEDTDDTNKMPMVQAASDSHMEDASCHKWESQQQPALLTVRDN